MASSLQEIPLRRIDGTPTTLAEYDGKVLLVVNVASECGLTPQYAGLQALYERYRDRGLEVLGFPANEFGAQEPGNNATIAQFCERNYGVQFPMFEKVVVKGPGQHPLFEALTKGTDISWNFEKFIIDRHGNFVERFGPQMTPDDPALIGALDKELAAT